MTEHNIPFNKPYVTDDAAAYLQEAVNAGKISGNGMFTKKCHSILERITDCRKALLTTSCTDALEMSAILLNITPGDEVIMPSFTFVSTANAFLLRGAKIVFVDSRNDHPGMDEKAVESLITKKTKAIVAVHYAGVACDMGTLSRLADTYGLYLVEDAAQAIDSYYVEDGGDKRALGSIGNFGTLSFHETKNIQCGEGGALLVNRPEFEKRSEIIWEKGTNRAAFWRGEIDKYGWVDIGSSFLPSELVAAYLYAQLERVQEIQKRRVGVWNHYHQAFETLEGRGILKRPSIPAYATNNGHMYYLVCDSGEERSKLIEHLKKKGVHSVFHYQSLHGSKFFTPHHDGRKLSLSDMYSDCLLRLPLHLHLESQDTDRVVRAVEEYYL